MFHHDEVSSGLYSGGFSKSFGLELTKFPGFLNKITLNYIALHCFQIWHHAITKGGVIENAAMP